jgi:hypothetical protein
MLPSVTAAEFRMFLDGTGKPFTELLDSVVRANAARLSISPADVHTNVRVNVQDGGVDTQVDNGSDPDGLLSGPTLWQYKARRFADMPEASVREEIHGSRRSTRAT